MEQIQTIKVLSLEANLVDFLYKLGAGPSMVRVHDLSLQPDAPHQRLQAEIRLVASYQKTSPASAAKTATATAKSTGDPYFVQDDTTAERRRGTLRGCAPQCDCGSGGRIRERV